MIDAFDSDLPLQLCVRAFYGTSFSPERRAESHRADYAATLTRDYETLRQQAEKGHTLDLLDAEFSRYREGYAKRYRAWLASHANCLSSMIAGPSNFPVRRAQKRNDIADRRMKETIDFREKALKAIITTLRPDLRPIMSGDSDACERLSEEIRKAEEFQARMKAANAAIRKHKAAGPAAQIAALVALGLSESAASEAIKPDFCGRIGFPDYALSNNNANIRRMKERLATISAAKATPDKEILREGLRIEDAPADNRIRLFFDGKPAPEVRADLKSHGFRWAPSIGAWQAYRNSRSLEFARNFTI